MGKEKRLFLLAVMTVMMSTVGYGRTIGGEHNNPKEPNKEFYDKDGIKVEKPKDVGYSIKSSGSTSQISAIIKTDIVVTEGKGIELAIRKVGKGDTKVTFEGKLSIENEKGIGVNLVVNDNKENIKNEFINDGTIKVAGGKGIQLNNEKDVVTNNNEIIVDKDTNGIGVSMSAGNFTNSETGKITVGKDGIGIEQSGGTSKNEGTITVSGGIGIKQENGVSTNNGMIDVKSGAGVEITSGTFTNEKDGEIKVTAGHGIKSLGGTTINDGKITVNGGVGVFVKNSTFTNNKDIEILTKKSGISLSDGSIVHNNGKINAINGTGVSIAKGTFNNTGKEKNGIYASGILKNEKGEIVFNDKGGVTGVVGINQSGGTVNNSGLIKSEAGAIGIKISGGTLNNIGTIEASGVATIQKDGKEVIAANSIGIEVTNNVAITNDGTIKSNDKAIGVKVTKGTFTNTGTIETKDKDSIGIDVTANGKSTNAGTITVDDGATGAKVTGRGTFTNEKEIKVIGSGAKGIYAYSLNSAGGGKAENKGTILVGDETTKAKQYATGMEAYGKNSEAINNGSIIVFADEKNTTNAMVAKNNGKKLEDYSYEEIKENGKVKEKKVVKNFNGKVVNEKDGKITVNGKAANAMSASGAIKVKITDGEHKDKYKTTGHTTTVAENKGTITLENRATGIKIDGKAIGVNTGTISGTGTGVSISDSLFVNSGTIDVGKNGIAIENKGILANEITDENKPAQDRILNNTVYLKNGSKITGKIKGAEGVDVLGLGKGTYDNLDVSNYEALTVRDGNVKISNSTIGLEYNKGTKSYLIEANKNMNIYDGEGSFKVENKAEADKKVEEIKNKEVSGNLTMADTTLAINFKDSLTNKEIENPIINIGKDGTLTFEKGMTLVFDSSDGRKKFDIYDALGLDENNGKIELGGTVDEVLGKTAVWDYYIDSNGHLTAEKESYDNVISKSQLKDFANILDEQEIGNKGLGASITALETLKTQEEFTNAVTQMSGGVHGYIADFAALNVRTMTNTMRNRALTRDYMRKRPLNSWTQDISYIDNNHRLGGLMNVDYTEKGVLGISEKQILPNGKLGLVYGGSKGNAKFDGGQSGSSTLDGAYFGGYYNHEFNNKWSLNSNANFVYTHNKVTRNVNFADINENFKSAYPTYTVGMGTSLIYTVKDDLRNKAHFYAGVDVERIMVGNINENKDIAKDETGLAIKTTSYNPRTYYSIVPSAGFMVQNTGYVFDKKYRIGADLNWETEVGNIKDGKRLQLTGLDKEYKVETSKRENVFSYSLFGALDLTESLSVNARYTSMFSDEYDADMIGAGFEYKMDTMADNFFGTFAHKLENNRPFSDRWGGTFGLIMETDDVDDYTKYDDGHPTSGDVATSMEYKPKMILSLNDKQSNWSYYFEAYHKTNNMFGSIKSDERESHASRYHGEARWNDIYSKGSYGMSFGYRNENSRKSDYYASNKTREIVKNGTHELRITPSFTYDLGHGFTLGGKSAIVFMYKYEGDRAGQMDMNTESQIGFIYTGFMPRWSIIANFYREDTWYDHSYEKMTKVGNDYFDRAPKNDQVNQLRPSIIYYFGNGASFRFDARIPLGNGSWANLNDGTNGNQAYETRYGFNYYYPVTPGLILNVGGIFLNTKTKNKDHSDEKYGNITRGYAFRPNIGFYYSF